MSASRTFRVRHDYADGSTQEWERELWDQTAAEGLASRVARLKAARTPHTVDGMTVTYKGAWPLPHTVTLTYGPLRNRPMPITR
ncbi:MAG: hypothetical protein JJE50_15520 [Actinomycetales bacterium]|nr:hypothetical protein [Actinomycetales bacterium]